MKICIVSLTYPTLSGYGGIGLYSQVAAQALAQRGHEVHVLVAYYPHHEWKSESHDGAVHLHIQVIRGLGFFDRWFEGLGESLCLAWRLWKLQRKYHFDAVEFPNWMGMGLVSTLLNLAPIVVRLHTDTAESVALLGRSPRRDERFLIWAERTSARRARATVTHSEAQRQLMRQLHGLSNIHLVPHGIPIPEDRPSVPATPPAVLIVGGLNERKGVRTLLAAIPKVLEAVPEAEFWITGGGRNPRYEQEFRQAHPNIPTEKVRFFGHVPQEKLAELYDRCALHASASIHESFGFSFVEAMAHAKPVVACDSSSMPEIIVHDETGLLVTPNDTSAFTEGIVSLLRDPIRCLRLGEAGYRRARSKFSLARMGKGLEQLFQTVVNEK